MKKVFVIGHKNPDTDSICSAIAYANLKNKQNKKKDDVCYVPARAGKLNEETQYVLKHFKVEVPEYIADVSTQVKDIEIRHTAGISENISLKQAWSLMQEQNVVTLPVTDEENNLHGLINVGDITQSYMEVYDSRILSTAKTRYQSIIETLEGELVEGDPQKVFEDGKVLIAAANPDLMEDYIKEGDLVILGNRYESQLCAIEMKAACIIVCEGAKVSVTIRKLAQENGCVVISSPHDTYTVARLINQSMPVSYFMKRENLYTFCTEDFIDNIRDVMAKKRYRDFPILSTDGKYVGMISRRNLLNSPRKEVIMVDHNEKGQAVEGIENADILEIIDHHRLRSVETITPVFFRNQPLGCTATIVTQMYNEQGVEIDKQTAGLLLSAILSDTLMFRSPTCTVVDQVAAEGLSRIAGVNQEKLANSMFRAGSNLKDKDASEIFYQDFKKFSINDVTFGVGQINAMNGEEFADLKDRLVPFMEKELKGSGVQMLFMMLTDIVGESTNLLYVGDGASDLISSAFGLTPQNGSFLMKGVVSRKKQVIPAIMSDLQQ